MLIFFFIYIQVRAFNKVGDGDWSMEMTVTTLSKAQYIQVKAKLDEKARKEKETMKEGKKKLDSLVDSIIL